MTDPNSISIRPLSKADQAFLWEMLYHALYVPRGAPPFPPEVVKRPEIARYVQNWGKAYDIGFVAVDETSRLPIGAVWSRLLTGENRGYGYVDDMTPELGVAVKPDHRGRGIGTALLVHHLKEVQRRHRAISLSVSQDNPAVRLYRRMGFETVASSGESLTMVRRLAAAGD